MARSTMTPAAALLSPGSTIKNCFARTTPGRTERSIAIRSPSTEGRRPSAELRDRAVSPATASQKPRPHRTQGPRRCADRLGEVPGPAGPETLVASRRTTTGSSRRMSLREATPSGASTPAKSWAGSRPGRFAVRWTPAARPAGGDGRREFTDCPAIGSSRAWRGRWWRCWPRLALSSASRRTEPDAGRPARSSCPLMNTRWRRGSRTSSGRRCPTTSCSGLAERGELQEKPGAPDQTDA